MTRIAIIGAHSEFKRGAPYQDRGWTVWACSMKNMLKVPRWDVWFELHRPLGPDDYEEWLKGLPSVYVRSLGTGLPGERLYPEAEMRARFGPFFFTSSIAYMLALAIAQKPEEIGLWGVHMATHEEYEYQRPGCQYFIQRALDDGIKVTVPPKCNLLHPPEERW